MRILLTGVSGFAGAALLPRLLDDGHDVRGFARDRARVEQALSFGKAPALGTRATLADFELVVGDALEKADLKRAMREVEVVYYLIHSMEPTRPEAEPSPSVKLFPERERLTAQAFARAARDAGVRRIVYLGGPLPRDHAPSAHLSSRHAVERILLEAVPDSVTLRASVVIGARSRSFRFLVRLVERLPVLALPSWRRFSTRPIDERDVVDMLAACATCDEVSGQSLDVGGPNVLTYGEMVQRIADLMMLGRPAVGLGVSATPIAGRIAAVIAEESPEFVLPLMESLAGDLLPADDRAADIFDVKLHSFDAAVEHALHEWEKVEPLAAR